MPSTRLQPTPSVTHNAYPDDPRLQLLERQLQRFSGDGDCAYERALSTLYQTLFEQRLSQLAALRSSGL